MKQENIPDRNCYKSFPSMPCFVPWLYDKDFIALYQKISSLTSVSRERCYILYTLLLQAMNNEGEVWECGVYKGGTAILLQNILFRNNKKLMLRLFDTFTGMPEVNSVHDLHAKGDFSDISFDNLNNAFSQVSTVKIHKGYMPDTFAGLEDSQITFAHIDVDIYQSVLDCSEFIYPRVIPGGFVVYDDYGFEQCPGSRAAVDEFFATRCEKPLILPTGQAIVFKNIPKAV